MRFPTKLHSRGFSVLLQILFISAQSIDDFIQTVHGYVQKTFTAALPFVLEREINRMPERIRTSTSRVKSTVLCQLSYRHIFIYHCLKVNNPIHVILTWRPRALSKYIFKPSLRFRQAQPDSSGSL